MKDNNTNSYNNMEDDSIDIIAFVKTVWTDRKLIIKIVGIFMQKLNSKPLKSNKNNKSQTYPN